MSQEQQIINHNIQYELTRRIGSGTFGTVFHGINLISKEEVAIKVENINSEHPQLCYESKVIKYLNENVKLEQVYFGFPEIISCSQDQGYNIMVMELLGPSLNDLLHLLEQFSIKTVLMISIQMINLIQELHKQRFIHRDLKLSNFTIGRKEKNNKIYLIDMGLAKKYMDRDKNHIALKEGKKFVGNVKYCSVNCHQLIEQSRRDDLESVCYIMMHLVKGTLPWLNIKALNKEEKYEKIHKSKMKNNNDNLLNNIEKEFNNILIYAKSLQFEQEPDYDMIRILLHQLATNLNIEIDYVYDWNQFIKSTEIIHHKYTNNKYVS